MNLLSDLSSELAVAIFLEKKHSEKVGSTDAVNLIGKIFEILEPISTAAENKQMFPKTQEIKVASH